MRSVDAALDAVCNLPADDREARLAMIRREILPLARRRERLADGVAFEFAADPALGRTLDQLVGFERQCCGGLSWDVTPRDDGTLRLAVRGLPPESPLLEAVGASEGSGAGRLARSLGLGGGVALGVCVLPLGIAALGGASLAAPLARLDQPLALGAVALSTAGGAWLWLGRGKRSSSPRG